MERKKAQTSSTIVRAYREITDMLFRIYRFLPFILKMRDIRVPDPTTTSYVTTMLLTLYRILTLLWGPRMADWPFTTSLAVVLQFTEYELQNTGATERS